MNELTDKEYSRIIRSAKRLEEEYSCKIPCLVIKNELKILIDASTKLLKLLEKEKTETKDRKDI